jgi:hypothetical protein
VGAVAFLALALACGSSSSTPATTTTTTAVISGTVTYTRVPLVKDAQGVPIGLADASVATNLQSLPARGVQVMIYQQNEQTEPNGTKTTVWMRAGGGYTDSTGHYSITVFKDNPTMVEIRSSFDGGGGQRVNLIGEPDGIGSLGQTTVLDRKLYALRKAADGSAPAGLNVPTSLLAADTTLDFSVGLTDTWWLIDPDYNSITGQTPLVTKAVLETSQPGRTVGNGTGSRVLAIGDTLASHIAVYGKGTTGTTLDLHYWPGRSEPRGTYLEYDLSAPLYAPAQNFDPSNNQFHLFGSIRGGAYNDDAWDEGVLLPIFARNALYLGNQGRTFSTSKNPLPPPAALLTNLVPDMARIEGLADAMAAAILKSPYLADTNGTSLATNPVTDIRDLTGLAASDLSSHSAPAIRSMAWQIILKANGIAAPGTSVDWAKIDPLATARFFQAPVTPTNNATDTTARDIEPINIYTQLKRLQEVKASTEPVDLAPRFTDAALTPLVAPFGLTWPRPTIGPEAPFLLDWGTDPNSATVAIPPIPFSMASSVQVNGSYPNVSTGEVVYAGFSLTVDKRYVLTATITPALASGASLSLDLQLANSTFTFTGAGGSTDPIVIPMASATPPYFHPVRLRLKSPTAIQPDFTVTLAFTPAP